MGRPEPAHVEWSRDEVLVRVKTPGRRYLDDLVNMTCAPDLLALELFPNAKEVTESFAAFNAVRVHLKNILGLADPNVRVLVVGDGSTPRTGATFAFRSAWWVCSVDPNLKDKKWAVQRLKTVGKRIEDCSPTDLTCYPGHFGSFDLVVAVHSHADLRVAVNRAGDNLAVVAIPCCVPQELNDVPAVEYTDWGIWSPERTVKVWRS